MLAAFKLLPIVWRLASILALLGALGSAYAYVKHQGYVDGYAVARGECEAEKAAQEAANKKAFSDALRQLLDQVETIQQKQTEIDDALTGIDEAVAADPDGGVLCLTADGVRRLQAIR